MTRTLIGAILLLALLAFPTVALTQEKSPTAKPTKTSPRPEERNEINVIHIYSRETRNLKLDAGQRANITVHLASDGEMLNGYFVSLVRLRDRKLLKTLKSDKYGVLLFKNLRADDYSLLLRKSSRLRKENTVRIGDVVLTVTGEAQGRKKKRDEYYN